MTFCRKSFSSKSVLKHLGPDEFISFGKKSWHLNQFVSGFRKDMMLGPMGPFRVQRPTVKKNWGLFSPGGPPRIQKCTKLGCRCLSEHKATYGIIHDKTIGIHPVSNNHDSFRNYNSRKFEGHEWQCNCNPTVRPQLKALPFWKALLYSLDLDPWIYRSFPK